MLSNKSWFSLIEILVGILIVSIVMIAWFQALSSVWVGKIKLIEKTKIEKEAYFAGEKFFEMIKKWGLIDYEEYWNRSIVNMSAGPNFFAGHYAKRSGLWNFWRNGTPGSTTYGWRGYNCRSEPGAGNTLGTTGCVDDLNTTIGGGSPNTDYSGNPHRYGQYERMFIDRNSDADSDGGLFWDEDGDGNLENDADDYFIAIWPTAFSGSTHPNKVQELYLINKEGDKRTLFRWTVTADPDAPASATCDVAINPENPSWNGCLWTIEFLKLDGFDYGYDHNPWAQNATDYQWDGKVDTWLIDEDFTPGNSTPVAESSATEYWQKIFPDTIHVSRAEFFLYPNKDLEYSWRDTDPNIQVAPYVQIRLTLEPSWKKRKKISWLAPSVDIVSTIHLTDLEFR